MKLFPIRIHIEELDGTDNCCFLFKDGTIMSWAEAEYRYGDMQVLAWVTDANHYVFISKEKRQ